ncbi:MAG TPA: NRDE family protein [Eoetvoesiella sp.]
MCIAYLALQSHPDWPLFIAANRDEFHERPTLAAAPWPTYPDVIGGIDCLAQGTWLGLTHQGRFALLTNYRDPAFIVANAPSRGALVGRYLTERHSPPSDYAREAASSGLLYNGFNLIVGNLYEAYYASNRAALPQERALAPGRYVISNHLLDSPWPKAERLRLGLDAFPLEQLEHSLTPVFELLKDNTQAADDTLPNTGIPLERERLLSSPFIVSPTYGTRCSTVIAVHASGRAIFSEISYNADGIAIERHDWPFEIENASLSP